MGSNINSGKNLEIDFLRIPKTVLRISQDRAVGNVSCSALPLLEGSLPESFLMHSWKGLAEAYPCLDFTDRCGVRELSLIRLRRMWIRVSCPHRLLERVCAVGHPASVPPNLSPLSMSHMRRLGYMPVPRLYKIIVNRCL